MSRWTPSKSDPVGPNERIGRRLFQRRKLIGAHDQRPPENTFELTHFEETRDDRVSVDRLGKTGVEAKVKRYLEPRCEANAAALSGSQGFVGWAVVSAKDLNSPGRGPSLAVHPSPVEQENEDPLSENIYHAHILRPGGYGSYEMAMHLKTIFEKRYFYEPASQSKPRSFWRELIERLLDWLPQRVRHAINRVRPAKD
jgi:hypothetical protein